MNTDTLALLRILQNVSYHFCLIMWMKNVNNFQIAFETTFKLTNDIEKS